MTIRLCGSDGCRLEYGHNGKHNKFPEKVWTDLFNSKDTDKVNKAGYATPRGGDKGAYQNHVYRNNKVIIPFERLGNVDLNNYKDGYVIRLFPNQYFESSGLVKPEFLHPDAFVKVGVNAFLLYRTHASFRELPPLRIWEVRHLEKNGQTVTRRGKDVNDVGHYVLRLSSISTDRERKEGPPQGIFAPEYAEAETNYLSKAFLAWLIIKTHNSPYEESDFEHLETILNNHNLINISHLEGKSILNNSITSCPLCEKTIMYEQLHEMVSFDGASGLANSQQQVAGATRSTSVNLFHMVPLVYETLEHKPEQVAWGHAICNTRLGQRECLPLSELIEEGTPVGYIHEDTGAEGFGWISNDKQFIRTENGDVWIKITDAEFDLDSED
ncbi:BstXI family restriction endonuclease [Peribacillus frigoritolerans]|uniref:BstXI family restriction endonuclease n=1 Tax=Peribacillus frigoritolerans TaxID=450367 RepID=UPI0024C1FA8B|nr:BstXI family restriction endonuclease [Peribacillus frigoritolerans]WHX61045.1 BstXI family restriction endonuclease [Peribacillus frigoritolerans]